MSLYLPGDIFTFQSPNKILSAYRNTDKHFQLILRKLRNRNCNFKVHMAETSDVIGAEWGEDKITVDWMSSIQSTACQLLKIVLFSTVV